MASVDEKELRQLREIKKELIEIKDRSAPRNAFLNGVLYGAGALLGGIIAVAFVGWLLSLLGIIPGLDVFADYLQSLLNELPSRR